MVVHNFSVRTIGAYMSAVKRVYNRYQRPFEQLTENDLIDHICYLREDLGLSAHTMRIAVCALKYLYKNVLNRTSFTERIPYPHKEKHIRTILTGLEALALFENTENIKHRLLLKIVYSAGLRRSEIITLRISDIDWKNMQIIVRQGKGKKDRYTILAHSLKADFDAYMAECAPVEYLFYGRTPGIRLSENSTRWIMDQAVARAGISKPGVCLHSLRHSFATHLLVIHTDVFTVQKLMGHDDIRTTMAYFHLGNMANSIARSPMDILYEAHDGKTSD